MNLQRPHISPRLKKNIGLLFSTVAHFYFISITGVAVLNVGLAANLMTVNCAYLYAASLYILLIHYAYKFFKGEGQ